MVGGRFVCAIAMLGIATPALAGERPTYAAVPDALTLLMQDQATTFGSRATLTTPPSHFDAGPRIAMLAEQLPDTLTRFETLMVPARMTLPAAPGVESLSFALVTDDAEAAEAAPPVIAPFGARRAVADTLADYPRPFRRRAILDTMLTLRLDGEERTRSFTVGGVAGVVWGVLPRR